MSPRYQFTTISHLAAGAQGEPGKRAFYLEVGQGERWVRTWLEKVCEATRLRDGDSSEYAFTISSSSAARMMQPARQMRAISAGLGASNS